MNNLLYIVKSPIPNLFHIGMTHDGRSPHERWSKDADYSKTPYLLAEQPHVIYDIAHLLDHDIHKDIKQAGLKDGRELGLTRSPEIFVCQHGLEHVKSVVRSAIKGQGVAPVELTISEAKEQQTTRALSQKTLCTPKTYGELNCTRRRGTNSWIKEETLGPLMLGCLGVALAFGLVVLPTMQSSQGTANTTTEQAQGR